MKNLFVPILLLVILELHAQIGNVGTARVVFNKCETTYSSASIVLFPNQIWNGLTFQESGVYVEKIPNSAGCDSVMTLNVKILYSTLPGQFSISPTQKVYFSKGNLQYSPNPLSGERYHKVKDGSQLPGVWRFAEKQYDMIGGDNIYISNTYTGWIDLFGFGTSGWNNGINGKSAYEPFSVSSVHTEYINQTLEGKYSFADWGVYNAISNGGNDPQTQEWFTLSYAEWSYLLNGRPNANVLRSAASINGIPGYVLLPDDWFASPPAVKFKANGNAFDNSYTLAQWNLLEERGAVFLPCAGDRVNSSTSVTYTSDSYYWSRSYVYYSSTNYAGAVSFTSTPSAGSYSLSERTVIHRGRAVRLVRLVY